MKEYVAWFVPREQAMQAFVEQFQRETESLAQALDPGRVDRTWLMQRLRHECSAQQVPYAYLDFGDGLPQDYMAIVRIARDQMGAAHFNLLTHVLNKIGTGALPSVDEVDHLRRQDIQVAAGRSTVEKDDYAFVRARHRETQQALEQRVTQAFYTCLEALCAKRPVVFILDSYEEASEAADHWIRANLLAWTCEGHLPCLVTLVAGRGEASLLPTTAVTHDIAALTQYVCLAESRRPASGQERDHGRVDE